MASSGTVPLNDVWAMLDACAPGYTKKQKPHNWVVTFNGIAYPRLPLGKHGTRVNPEIQIGHVKTMVRMFGIEACAAGRIERLR